MGTKRLSAERSTSFHQLGSPSWTSEKQACSIQHVRDEQLSKWMKRQHQGAFQAQAQATSQS